MAAVALPTMAQQTVKVISQDAKQHENTVCDTARYRIWYQAEVVQNAKDEQQKTVIKEPMRLDIGTRIAHFYSETAHLSDSLNEVLKAKGETRFISKGRFYWHVYSNYPRTGMSVFLDKIDFALERGKCEEEMEAIDWQLLPDSTRNILGYDCHLAQADFKGRTWQAWYADDVPLEYGPWKLGGLPGLILMAYDTEHHYTFTASAMITFQTPEPIVYNDAAYEPYSRKELNELQKRFHADPVGFMSQDPQAQVIVQDEHGNPAKSYSLPYNPIER